MNEKMEDALSFIKKHASGNGHDLLEKSSINYEILITKPEGFVAQILALNDFIQHWAANLVSIDPITQVYTIDAIGYRQIQQLMRDSASLLLARVLSEWDSKYAIVVAALFSSPRKIRGSQQIQYAEAYLVHILNEHIHDVDWQFIFRKAKNYDATLLQAALNAFDSENMVLDKIQEFAYDKDYDDEEKFERFDDRLQTRDEIEVGAFYYKMVDFYSRRRTSLAPIVARYLLNRIQKDPVYGDLWVDRIADLRKLALLQ